MLPLKCLQMTTEETVNRQWQKQTLLRKMYPKVSPKCGNVSLIHAFNAGEGGAQK